MAWQRQLAAEELCTVEEHRVSCRLADRACPAKWLLLGHLSIPEQNTTVRRGKLLIAPSDCSIMTVTVDPHQTEAVWFPDLCAFRAFLFLQYVLSTGIVPTTLTAAMTQAMISMILIS